MKKKTLPDCNGDCSPIYDDYLRQWKHTCNNSEFNQLTLTTCTVCMTIFNNYDKHIKCAQGYCKHCGQRFRFDIPYSRECFLNNLPLWSWCLQCKSWHCANCNQKLH